MPFCRDKVENSAVNYRGAKKSAGRKLGAEVQNGGLIQPKSSLKSGIPPSRLGRLRTQKLLSYLLSYCIHTTKAPVKANVYAVLQPYAPQFVANLSLISYHLPQSWRAGGVHGKHSRQAFTFCCDETNSRHLPISCQVFLLDTPRKSLPRENT